MVVLARRRLFPAGSWFSTRAGCAGGMLAECCREAVAPVEKDAFFFSFSAKDPGKVFLTGLETITFPVRASSNRVRSVSCRRGEPTSSNGIQKLYECPNLDRL
jgi:hypothetical protein